MADDRIFIRCKYCGGWKMLLKHFCGEGPHSRNNGILEWLDTHARCKPEQFFPHLKEPGFTLHIEDDIVDETLDLSLHNKKGSAS